MIWGSCGANLSSSWLSKPKTLASPLVVGKGCAAWLEEAWLSCRSLFPFLQITLAHQSGACSQTVPKLEISMQSSHHALPATSNGHHGWLICTIDLSSHAFPSSAGLAGYLFTLGTVPGGVLANTAENSSTKAYLVCGDGCG